VDFPDITRMVCERVKDGRAVRGILVCGTGVGASIVTNKIPGFVPQCATTFTQLTNAWSMMTST
jgi:ribose 5-phosphate isomerase B